MTWRTTTVMASVGLVWVMATWIYQYFTINWRAIKVSKKKLEEIAYNVGISIDGDKALMSSDDYDFLYRYALEQAERVQELKRFSISKDELNEVLNSNRSEERRVGKEK